VNGGPTVRRIHRERDQALGLGPGLRGRRTICHPQVGDPPRVGTGLRRPARADQPTAGLPPVARIEQVADRPGRGRGSAPVFPLSLADILGINAESHILVIDGEVQRLELTRRDPLTQPICYAGQRRYPRVIGRIDELVRDAVELQLPSLQQWVATEDGAYSNLDELSAPSRPEALSVIDDFVHRRLIPCIGRIAHARRDSEIHEAPIAAEAGGISLPTWERRFGFLDGRWCSLVPFSGREGHRLKLRIDRQDFLAIETQPWNVAVTRYDHMLQDAVRSGLALESEEAQQVALHRDGAYAVYRTPRGRTWVAQQQAPYVVEGADKKLYYFSAAEVGISVYNTQARTVLHAQSAQVLHPYPHMFVYGMGNFICMPRSSQYYDRLQDMPLEEALLHHLEEARMTLCAGYLPQSSGVHPIEATRRPTISLVEARRRRLPVYWYHKPRRRLRDQLRSLT
jgi:hypothetical protein